MTVGIFPSPEADFLELSRSKRGRLYKKHILTKGTLRHPATKRDVKVDDQFFDALVANFSNKVCDIVQVPIAGANNEHTEDPTRNIGEVVELQQEGDKLFAVIDARDEQYADKLGSTLLGASAMIHPNYEDAKTGAKVGPTLLHVCVTNRPYITELDDYEELIAATADNVGDAAMFTPEEAATMTRDELIEALKAEHGIDVPALQAQVEMAFSASSLSDTLMEIIGEVPLELSGGTRDEVITNAVQEIVTDLEKALGADLAVVAHRVGCDLGGAVLRRDAMERELDEELRVHLEQEAARHRAAGLPADEAVRQARLAFGGVEVVKEESRDGRGTALVEQVAQDLRHAVRALRRSPAFTLGVILTLGLGIGVNAAMFGIVDQLLFRAPPLLRDPERVHRVYLQWHNRNGLVTGSMMGYASYLDFRRTTTQFDALAGYSVRSLPVGSGPASREMPVGVISATLFDFFDAAPVLGRFFTAAEDTVPLGAQVAVLSHGFWQARYGGRPDALGQVLRVGTAAYTIIGVAPPGFEGISDEGPPALFIPITAYAGVFRAGANVARLAASLLLSVWAAR